VARSAPSYDGQFGPRVASIGADAYTRAQGLSSQMNNQSGELQRKAQAFEMADNAGMSSFTSLDNLLAESYRNYLSSLASFLHIPVDQLENYLKLGFLLNPGVATVALTGSYIFSGFSSQFSKVFGNPTIIQAEEEGWGILSGAASLAFKNSKSVSGGTAIIGALIGFLTDPERGKNPLRAGETAVAEEGVDTGIDLAIESATGVSGVGTIILLGNAAIQVFGVGTDMLARVEGDLYGGEWQQLFDKDAQEMEFNFDRIDLGNITHDLAHLVVDDVNNPALLLVNPNTAPLVLGQLATGQMTTSQLIDQSKTSFTQMWSDAGSLWTHTSGLVPGVIGTAGDISMLGNMTGSALSDKIVSILPVPAEWKDTIYENAISIYKNGFQQQDGFNFLGIKLGQGN
jgi:hypothetical protein